MMIGPAPMIKIRWMSVRLGIKKCFIRLIGSIGLIGLIGFGRN
jgi:hypothetical protein